MVLVTLLAVDFLAIGGRWDLAFISVILFSAFLLFIPFRRKVGRRTHSVYTAFIIALFTEMFGFPLTIYFISSYFSFSFFTFETQFLNYMSSFGMPVGLIITFAGLLLRVSGWQLIHKSHGKYIITNGIYRYIRHPQYLGFILITLGWLVHWPTIPTAIMWPILVAMYYKLSEKEEREMEKIFGEGYFLYKERVPMLVPKIEYK